MPHLRVRVPDRGGRDALMSAPGDQGSPRADQPPLSRRNSREQPDLLSHHTAREGRALSQTLRESSNWRHGYSDPATERFDLSLSRRISPAARQGTRPARAQPEPYGSPIGNRAAERDDPVDRTARRAPAP